jgi:glucokinase
MMLIFDLGGTHLRLSTVEKGELGEVHRVLTDRTAAGFAKFLGALDELKQGRNITAVAGGLPGQIRGEEGELVVAPNLKDWLGMPILTRLKELLDCPVFVTNDVELCGLGEARFGAGTTTGVMAYYTVSTGVNAVRIIDGNVDRSNSRYEVGKQIVNYIGGKAQTLESLTGGAAVQRRFGMAPGEIKDPAVWREVSLHLAGGVYNTALHWNPELVVMGGSMMRDIDLDLVAEELMVMPNVLEKLPKLVRAKLGDTGGLRGAVAWLEQVGYK